MSLIDDLKLQLAAATLTDKQIKILNSMYNGPHSIDLGDSVKRALNGEATVKDIAALVRTTNYGSIVATYKTSIAKSRHDPVIIEALKAANSYAKKEGQRIVDTELKAMRAELRAVVSGIDTNKLRKWAINNEPDDPEEFVSSVMKLGTNEPSSGMTYYRLTDFMESQKKGSSKVLSDIKDKADRIYLTILALQKVKAYKQGVDKSNSAPVKKVTSKSPADSTKPSAKATKKVKKDPDWWTEKTRRQQLAYLKKFPSSRLKPKAK